MHTRHGAVPPRAKEIAGALRAFWCKNSLTPYRKPVLVQLIVDLSANSPHPVTVDEAKRKTKPGLTASLVQLVRRLSLGRSFASTYSTHQRDTLTTNAEVAWNRIVRRTDLQVELTNNPDAMNSINERMGSELETIAEGPELSVDGLGVLDSTDRVFLGSDLLSQIWDDNDRMILPSWIGRLPPRIGSSQHGKLSADQLRTACTVNLVATLVRVWGIAPNNTKWKAVLDNFMDLVAAVKIAHLRTLTAKKIDKYHTLMHRYLRTVQQLYPHAPITSVQHMSLHLSQLLKQFGPVHAWRCFAFERYNGVIQNIPTNYKFGKSDAKGVTSTHVSPHVLGELESTLFNKFCKAQNLRVAMGHEDVQQSLGRMHQAFRNVFDEETRGTFFNDYWTSGFEEGYMFKNRTVYSTLSPHLQDIAKGSPIQLRSTRVLYQTSISRFGMSFSTNRFAPGDSMVIIGTVERWSPARITDIFVTSTLDGFSEPYLVVETYAPLSSKQTRYDRYREYPLAGHLFLNKISNTSIVKASEILCHFVATTIEVDQINVECIHVLPLLRVSDMK